MWQEANAKRDPNAVDFDEDDDTKLESVLIDIVSTNLADKMPKGDPEFKIFKENYDWVLDYYNERFDNIPDELHHEIFCEMNERAHEFVSILKKNLYELPDLLQFFWSILWKLNPLTVVLETEK